MKQSINEILEEFKEANWTNKIILFILYFVYFSQYLVLWLFTPWLRANLAKFREKTTIVFNKELKNSSIQKFSLVRDEFSILLVSINEVENPVNIREYGEAEVFREMNPSEQASLRNSFLVEANIKEDDYYNFRLFLIRNFSSFPPLSKGVMYINYEEGQIEIQVDPLLYYLTGPKIQLRNLWEG